MSPDAVITQPLQSWTVSDAAVDGGSTRYALAEPNAPKMRAVSKIDDFMM